jgi:hypothetical protein
VPSTPSESPLALIPLAPKSHASFKYALNCEQMCNFFYIFWSGLLTWMNCNRISVGLRYYYYFIIIIIISEAHRRVFVWGTMLQAGRSRVRFPMRSFNFSNDLILPAALCSAYNRNEYQESSWG